MMNRSPERSARRVLVAMGAISLVPAAAHADPRLEPSTVEVGGMLGLHAFSGTSELGVADIAGAPSPRNSVLPGLRAGILFDQLASPVVVGAELEAGLLPTSARDYGYSVLGFTGRVHLIGQWKPIHEVVPFAVLGVGFLSVVHSDIVGRPDDPMRIIRGDTDVATYIGGGAKYRLTPRWGVRGDARLLFVPSSANSTPPDAGNHDLTADFELVASVYTWFDLKKSADKPSVDDDPDRDGIRGALDRCPSEPEDKDRFKDDDGCPDADNDGDGIADATDGCPLEPEDKDGFEDENGCPDPDNDHDGLPDAEACPLEPEDKDGFKDDDGCPDPDNDGDGVLDAADKCGDQPEVMNGFQDDDGCPDDIPKQLRAFTGVIEGINFKVNSVELIGGSNKTLDKAAGVLNEFPDIKLEIQGHTDDQPLKVRKGSPYPDNEALSQGRAETVRAYFIKQGIAEDRLIAKGYGASHPVIPIEGLKGHKLTEARAKNRRVEFVLVTGTAAPAPTPTPAPAPAPTPAPAPAPTPAP